MDLENVRYTIRPTGQLHPDVDPLRSTVVELLRTNGVNYPQDEFKREFFAGGSTGYYNQQFDSPRIGSSDIVKEPIAYARPLAIAGLSKTNGELVAYMEVADRAVSSRTGGALSVVERWLILHAPESCSSLLKQRYAWMGNLVLQEEVADDINEEPGPFNVVRLMAALALMSRHSNQPVAVDVRDLPHTTDDKVLEGQLGYMGLSQTYTFIKHENSPAKSLWTATSVKCVKEQLIGISDRERLLALQHAFNGMDTVSKSLLRTDRT